jgi:hypothetical protein
LWCSQSDDHPENNLAKFGYIPDMKVNRNRSLLYSWLLTETYHKNLTIWIFPFFGNLMNLGHFFRRKILFIICWNNIFAGWDLVKICQLKKLSCASQIGSNPGDDTQPKFFNPKVDDESPKHLVQQVGLSYILVPISWGQTQLAPIIT